MFELKYRQTDILIIGGGIAGLRAAVTALECGGKALVLAKGPRCSAGIGGFNAPVGRDDSPSLFYSDIIASGRGLSDPALAKMLAEKSEEETTVDLVQPLPIDPDHHQAQDQITQRLI